MKREARCTPYVPNLVCGMPPTSSGGVTVAATLVSTAPQSSALSMLARTPDVRAGGADPRREGVVLGDTS